MKVIFETKNTSYNPKFVAKVLAGAEAKKRGETGIRIDVDNLWK